MADTQLIKGEVRVELEHIGEGWDGDYDPEDANDQPLMRFTVSRRNGEDWEQIEDASYCTRVSANADQPTLDRITQQLMDEVYEPATSGASIKKLCEHLSWIDRNGNY